MWDIEQNKLIKTFSGHNGEVRGVALTNDEKTIISGGIDGIIKFWDVTSGNLIYSTTKNNRA